MLAAGLDGVERGSTRASRTRTTSTSCPPRSSRSAGSRCCPRTCSTRPGSWQRTRCCARRSAPVRARTTSTTTSASSGTVGAGAGADHRVGARRYLQLFWKPVPGQQRGRRAYARNRSAVGGRRHRRLRARISPTSSTAWVETCCQPQRRTATPASFTSAPASASRCRRRRRSYSACRRVSFGVDQGLAGWACAKEPRPYPRRGLDDERHHYVPELEEERFQSLVAIPIPSRAADAIGAIVLHTVAPREFDERILNVLAGGLAGRRRDRERPPLRGGDRTGGDADAAGAVRRRDRGGRRSGRAVHGGGRRHPPAARRRFGARLPRRGTPWPTHRVGADLPRRRPTTSARATWMRTPRVGRAAEA